MSISIDRYVSIASGVAGAATVGTRELVGLRLSLNPRVPIDAVVTVTNATDALTYFGSGSSEALFAADYFWFTGLFRTCFIGIGIVGAW